MYTNKKGIIILWECLMLVILYRKNHWCFCNNLFEYKESDAMSCQKSQK